MYFGVTTYRRYISFEKQARSKHAVKKVRSSPTWGVWHRLKPLKTTCQWVGKHPPSQFACGSPPTLRRNPEKMQRHKNALEDKRPSVALENPPYMSYVFVAFPLQAIVVRDCWGKSFYKKWELQLNKPCARGNQAWLAGKSPHPSMIFPWKDCTYFGDFPWSAMCHDTGVIPWNTIIDWLITIINIRWLLFTIVNHYTLSWFINL